MIAASSEYCEYYREISLTPTFNKQILGTACVTTYYCSLIALSIYYLVVSCYPVLPWTVCHDHLQGAEQGAEQEGEKAAPSPVSPSSPQAGVYSVSSGCVLQPATVIHLHISTSQYLHISTISTHLGTGWT